MNHNSILYCSGSISVLCPRYINVYISSEATFIVTLLFLTTFICLPPEPCYFSTLVLQRMSKCWRFYAVPTARVIFTAKTCLDVFSLSREQVWIYKMMCPFVAVGLIACFIVLPHWDNMSQAHMLTHPVTLY